MNKGRIEQVGTPTEIYHRPRTRFVADFIGEINLLDGEWREDAFVSKGIRLPAQRGERSGGGAIAIRPERVRLTDPNATVRGRIENQQLFISGQMIYRIALEDGRQVIVRQADRGTAHDIGALVGLDWAPDDVVILND